MTPADTIATATRATTAGPAPTGATVRRVLLMDAAVTGLNGAVYLLAVSILDDVLGLPAGLLAGVGLFLVAFAVAVWSVGKRAAIHRRWARTVVAANLLWVIASVAVAVGDWGTPTTVGTVWIGLQAAVVAGFAVLQSLGMRAHPRPGR